MPTIEYTCRQCLHRFQRVVLRGEAIRPAVCPQCQSPDTRAIPGPSSLFDGITGFSSLARDTN